MDLRKKLEFKNEVTESDKMKHNILFVSKIIEAAKNSKSFEDYTAKINEDKEGLMMYGFGAPKYTTLDYILDIEVYDFLSTLGINVEQQIHQVDM